MLPTQGNSLAVETTRGVVVVDAGPGGRVTATQIEALRSRTEAPVRAIVYSHGHVGYNNGVPAWQAHAAERGDPPPDLVAHHRVPARYARYRETAGLQGLLTRMQFPGLPDHVVEGALALVDPTTTFVDELRIDDPERPVVLRAAPSETDDALTAWLPAQRILYGGAATPGASIPNVGTPLRTQRGTVRWAETLEGMETLGAEALVQEFGPVVEGADEVATQLATMADALRWLRARVVEAMNAGRTDVEVLGSLAYPPELFDHPYMAEVYGARDYIVRDLFREENGWWASRNPTDLHPAPPDEVAAAVLGAVDPARVLAHARVLAGEGRLDLALAVVDLVALAPGDDPVVVEARDQKADWCDARAGASRVFVSQSLYRSSAALLRRGHTRWSQVVDPASTTGALRPVEAGGAS